MSDGIPHPDLTGLTQEFADKINELLAKCLPHAP
jgi:hypothetical protein